MSVPLFQTSAPSPRAIISTPDKGYFVSTNLTIAGIAGSAQTVSTAQQVRSCQFVLGEQYTITKVTITVAVAGAAGSTVTAGIYSADGTTKLIDSGTFDGTSNTTQTKTISPVTLPPGVYHFAQSCSTPTTLTANCITQGSMIALLLNNQTIKKCGIATNAAVAGVLPASLGGISSATNYSMLLASFEP